MQYFLCVCEGGEGNFFFKFNYTYLEQYNGMHMRI